MEKWGNTWALEKEIGDNNGKVNGEFNMEKTVNRGRVLSEGYYINREEG